MTKAQAEIVEAPKSQDASSVTGCIDAIAGDRVFGWAWDAKKPSTRIAIRVEVEGKVIAAALADQPREDLATNGIGDGKHAFEIAVAKGTPPEKMRVYSVCSQTGETMELTQRAAEGSPEAGGPGEELRSAVHALYRSQRFAQGKVESLVDTVEGLRKEMAAKDREAAVATRLETIEVAVARIDALIREQATKLDELEQRPTDQISRIVACAAMIVAGAALVVALLR